MKKLFLSIAVALLLATNTKAQFIDIYDFHGATGNGPNGSLTLSGNTMYGMAPGGGTANDGVIFSININGSGYNVLYNFSSLFPYSVDPASGLTLSDGILYGMTWQGGANDGGCVFRIGTNGNGYEDLYDFGSGYHPQGSLTITGDTLYGMTEYGGVNNSDGTIFSINNEGGGFTELHDFNGTEGSNPYGTLIISGNILYGMASSGGAYGDGCIFYIYKNGSGFKDMYDFGGIEGSNPYGSLILLGNILYGMTSGGGAHSQGCIFSVHTDGTGYKVLYSFIGIYGYYPYSSLLYSGNSFYGMALDGGANNYGNIFSIDTNGNGYKDLWDFDDTGSFGNANGIGAYGSLIILGGVLYGICDRGGAKDSGLIFGYNLCSTFSIKHDSVPDNGNCNGTAGVNVSGGTSPYTYYWSAGHTSDTINNKCAGTYTCTITDNNGCSQTTSVTIKNTTGIEYISNSSAINIYPVPNNGQFIIQSSGINGNSFVGVYNVLGEKIYYGKLNPNITQINLSNQPAGLYLYRVITEQGQLIASGKFIIQ